jgi:16S rRNA (guanine527-N7)-methyltransferase
VKHDEPERVVAPAPPAGAKAVFGDRLPLATAYASTLADTGVSHGLVGPREVPRLWERHLLNCAVVHEAFPERAVVIDVGSGAGLPGIVLAIARPDLEVHLVEPMRRRTTWLEDVVGQLGLEQVRVHRGRAEDLGGDLSAPWVTGRAVARLGRLATWCLPLLEPGGTLVAMKGRRAAEELSEDREALEQLGMTEATVSRHGVGVVEEPVLTVDLCFGGVRREASRGPRRSRARGRASTRRRG